MHKDERLQNSSQGFYEVRFKARKPLAGLGTTMHKYAVIGSHFSGSVEELDKIARYKDGEQLRGNHAAGSNNG